MFLIIDWFVFSLLFDLFIHFLFRKRQLDSVFRYEPKTEIKLNATRNYKNKNYNNKFNNYTCINIHK